MWLECPNATICGIFSESSWHSVALTVLPHDSDADTTEHYAKIPNVSYTTIQQSCIAAESTEPWQQQQQQKKDASWAKNDHCKQIQRQ